MNRLTIKTLFVTVSVLFMLMQTNIQAQGSIRPAKLTCEYLENPLGIDVTKPHLAWKSIANVQNQRNLTQTAYQIIVSSSAKGKGDVWNSGKVASDASNQIAYNGTVLKSHTKYYWKVKVWDQNGEPSDWSNTATWTTGLFSPNDWQASWVTWQPAPAQGTQADPHGSVSPWLRKTFDLTDNLKEATAYVNVVGYFELYVNGKKVGNDILKPAVSDYAKRSFYLTYDIRPYLQKGKNCIALWLGRGWYDPDAAYRDSTRGPGARARIQVEMTGKKKTLKVLSDETWKAAASPYTTIGLYAWGAYHGEQYDARMENKEWNMASYNDSKWEHVRKAPSPSPRTESQLCPPSIKSVCIEPKKITDLGEGRYEIDFGTNLSGSFGINLPRLKKDQLVKFYYADTKSSENLKGQYDVTIKVQDGKQESYQTFSQYDIYVASGMPNEKFETKFNYHGYRYVIVENLLSAPTTKDVEAYLVESDLKKVGSFSCSNDLFNRIRDLNLWTIRCLNLGGYMVDCPHRERLGYGDGQVSIETCIMNFGMQAFYPKWAQDWVDVQDEKTGDLPHTAPTRSGGGGIGWGGAMQALTWRQYLYYGDKKMLENNYDACKRYVQSIEAKTKDGILHREGNDTDGWSFIGDWLAPDRGMDAGNNPSALANEFFNNCYRIYLMEHLAKMAAILGKTEEEKEILLKLPKIRSSVHKTFYDENRQMYVIDEQPYYVMPLMTGVVPENLRSTITKKLEDNILIKAKGHLNTGMLGTYFLINYLHDIGRDDLIYTIMNQKTYPGWGYMIEKGATTMWEAWNGYWSMIHSCFTSPGSWFHQGLAGINADESAPGFKRVIIKPSIVGDLIWAKARHNSIYGEIESNWEIKDGDIIMNVTIPVNTKGQIYIPTRDVSSVTESGKSISNSNDIKFLAKGNNYIVYEVGSGIYKFSAKKIKQIKNE